MSKYMNWELYDKPPEGFSIDKHTGSPLTGYDFYTTGKALKRRSKNSCKSYECSC